MAAASLALLLAWIPGVGTWLIVWCGLAAATVVIGTLLRTRWREVKPWKKCALLSLWVHVLLACIALNVRIGVGGAGVGPGSGGPIRVMIVSVPPTRQAARLELPQFAAPGAANANKEEPPDPAEVSVEADAVPTPVAVDAQPNLATAEVPQREPSNVASDADAVVPNSAPLPAPADSGVVVAPALLPRLELNPDPPTPVAPPEMDSAPDAQVAKSTTTEGNAPDVAPAIASAIAYAPDSRVATSTDAAAPKGAVEDAAGTSRDGVPAEYASRFADRDALVVGGGGNPTTERAVRAALIWLAHAQNQDGHWDPKRFGAGQERYVFGEDRGGAGAKADTGITALALLAFLGAGHTHHEGPYADNVARALDFLRRKQGANGNLSGDAEFFAHMYCHSMATFAIGEACAITGDAKLKPIVERAVAYSLAAQHPTQGGWRYKANPGADGGDTSQLGWQLMALKSAELAGVSIPAVTWTRVDRFLRNVERGAAGGLAAYRPEGPPSRAMTAEALFCRQLLTRRADGGLSASAFEEARKAMLDEPPGGVVVNFYYWYYATIALHRAQHRSTAAAEAWSRWNESLTKTLVNSQSSDGSWSSACLWGGYGGRVYTTAIAAMCLEVYYRYAGDEAEQTDFARRDEWQVVPAR
jgi:hypothetical protein